MFSTRSLLCVLLVGIYAPLQSTATTPPGYLDISTTTVTTSTWDAPQSLQSPYRLYLRLFAGSGYVPSDYLSDPSLALGSQTCTNVAALELGGVSAGDGLPAPQSCISSITAGMANDPTIQVHRY